MYTWARQIDVRIRWAALLLVIGCVTASFLVLRGQMPLYCVPDQEIGGGVYVPLHDQIAVLTNRGEKTPGEHQFSTVNWYRARDGAYMQTSPIHPSLRLQVSPDSAWLLALGVDRVLRFYNVTTHREEQSVRLPHEDTPFAIDTLGTYLASARPDGGVDIMRIADEKLLTTLATDSRVTHLLFHPVNQLLVIAEPSLVSFWDVSTAERLQGVTSDQVIALSFSQRGTKFAKADVGAGLRAGTFQSRISVWGFLGGTTSTETGYTVQDPAITLAFSPDGRRLAVAGDSIPGLLLGEWPWVRREITIIDTENAGRIIEQVRTPFRAIIHIAYASDGTLIMAFGADTNQKGQICVWERA